MKFSNATMETHGRARGTPLLKFGTKNSNSNGKNPLNSISRRPTTSKWFAPHGRTIDNLQMLYLSNDSFQLFYII